MPTANARRLRPGFPRWVLYGRRRHGMAAVQSQARSRRTKSPRRRMAAANW